MRRYIVLWSLRRRLERRPRTFWYSQVMSAQSAHNVDAESGKEGDAVMNIQICFRGMTIAPAKGKHGMCLDHHP